MKKQSRIQKNFEIFAKGVERLKELEKELNALDTRGFSREEQEIRTHLKSVADIPFIEKKLKQLKLKISHKYTPPRKRTSKISKDIQEIKQTLPSLKQSLKGDIQSLKDQVPSLRKEIQAISKKLEHKEKKAVIDSSVGLLVDEDFNDFLKHLKVSLSAHLQNQERSMNIRLQRDLQTREKLFREKYIQLVNDFQKKKKKLAVDYKKKYKVTLKKEMHEKIEKEFDTNVREKIERMKSEIRGNYLKQLNDHAHLVLERKQTELRNKLQKGYAQQSAVLMKEFQKKLARIHEEQRLKNMQLQQHKEKLELFYHQKIEHESEEQEREHEAQMHSERNKLEQKKLALQENFKEKMKHLHDQLKKELDSMHRREKDLSEVQLTVAQQSKQSQQHEHQIEKAYEKKILSLENEKKDFFEKEKARLMEEHHSLMQQLESRKQQLLENLRVKKQAEIDALRAEKSRLQKLQSQYSDKSVAFDEKNAALENNRREINKDKEALSQAQQSFAQRKEAVIKQIRTKLAQEFHSHLEKELSKKEAFLRSELQAEYSLKLKKHIQAHEENLQKRKLEIEMQLQKNLKHILK